MFQYVFEPKKSRFCASELCNKTEFILRLIKSILIFSLTVKKKRKLVTKMTVCLAFFTKKDIHP
jgi:hypothetical protein